MSKTKAALKLPRRKNGAALSELQEATGWQAHSVRGFLSGTVKNKLGLNLSSEVDKKGVRRYRITTMAAADRSSCEAMTIWNGRSPRSAISREKNSSPWHKTYGCPPPKGINRLLLERSAAWHLQAKKLGGPSAAARAGLRVGYRTRKKPSPSASQPDSGDDVTYLAASAAVPLPQENLHLADRTPAAAPLLYVGIAPRAPSRERNASRSNLRKRIRSDHLGTRIGSSTLRRSLATLLRISHAFGAHRNDAGRPVMTKEDEARLTAWMAENAAVSYLTHPQPWDVEAELIANGPSLPLNIAGSSGPGRKEIIVLRSVPKSVTVPRPK